LKLNSGTANEVLCKATSHPLKVKSIVYCVLLQVYNVRFGFC
jgi:hypothetical protein